MRHATLLKQTRYALVTLFFFTIVTGILYPMTVTGIGQLLFPHRANGSLVTSKTGKITGSELIGQSFSSPAYFWGRLSATTPFADNPGLSFASNLGPNNPALLDAVQKRIADLQAADPGNTRPVPVDLVTASGSGLDPHISVAAALYQLPRVARVRGLSAENVRHLVDQSTDERQLGILGEPRVNVLHLNLLLDSK